MSPETKLFPHDTELNRCLGSRLEEPLLAAVRLFDDGIKNRLGETILDEHSTVSEQVRLDLSYLPWNAPPSKTDQCLGGHHSADLAAQDVQHPVANDLVGGRNSAHSVPERISSYGCTHLS